MQMIKPPKAGRCHVRLLGEADIPEMERMYLAHEGVSIPEGYFEEFQATIRDESVFYFVAEVDGRLVGGGGISQYLPRSQALLTFGIVDPNECRKGFGTAIMLARLLFVDSGSEGCQIALQATEWSVGFFTRLGFSWYHDEEDETGNLFFSGSHAVLPGDDRVFRRILAEGGVTLGFDPDRGWINDSSEPSDPPFRSPFDTL